MYLYQKSSKLVGRFIVGIDPSLTNTGIAILSADTGELVSTGETKDCLRSWHAREAGYRHSPKGQADRLLRIVRYVEDSLIVSARLWVGYEDYSFDSINRPFALGELGGVLKTCLAPICEDFVLASPKSLKSFAVQNGMAEKADMTERAKHEACGTLGEQPSSDICDAYFLAKYAWYRFFPEQVVDCEQHRDLLRHRLNLTQATTI